MIDRHSSHPPYTVRCDVKGCQETFTGQPWQGMPATRRASSLAQWRSRVVRHNESPAGVGVKRIEDFCPGHGSQADVPARKAMKR